MNNYISLFIKIYTYTCLELHDALVDDAPHIKSSGAETLLNKSSGYPMYTKYM